MLYPPNCSSVCPSVSASFPDSNLSSFWPIFFKLCMDIDIREECFEIANGLDLYINNRVTALDWCKNMFFLNILRTNWWILITLCVCIDIYKICIVPVHVIFGKFLTALWPLIFFRILFMLNILWINWYWQDVDLDDWTICFVHFQQSYGPWLMSKFHLCSISCGPIDGFW